MKCLTRHRPQRAHAGGLSKSHIKQHLAKSSNPLWTAIADLHTIWIRKTSIPGRFQNDKMAKCRLTHPENRAVRHPSPDACSRVRAAVSGMVEGIVGPSICCVLL